MTSSIPHPQLLSKAELLTRLQQNDVPLIVAVKRLMEQFREQADQYFRQTLDARVPVQYRASQMDALIAALWCHSGLDQPELALVAVGGYGRGELHPYSDIDLLLLCQDEQAIQQHGESLQGFITLLWDIKLDVGHSVRTLVDCQRESANDLTIITNMLESRLLIGSQPLFNEFQQIVDCRDHWPAEIFFQQKWQELQDRHDKHNDSEYNLEPNVKNSPGALRDIQTLCWVTLRHFGGQSGLLDLKENGFLTEFEYIRLNDSLNFLWQVRYALHMIAGREEDRLLFDLQREIADLLGFKAEGNLLSVERFMMRVYRNQLATLEICDVLLLHFNETFMKSHQPPNLIRLNEHFVLNNGYLQVNDPALFTREPIWLLKVFQLCAHTDNLIGVHSDTIRALRDNRNHIDEAFRSSREHNAIFMELIRNEHHVVRELTRMMRYGILGRYIPEFGKIIGQMEHDLLHVYTVDDHTFRMIRFMRHLRFSDQRIKFPVASRLIHRVNKPELLYLAALLHDTGKYLDGNHTQTGAHIAEAFCRQHNLRPTESHMVSWLIENHLTMPYACQHLDLNNPEHIHQFAQQMGDQTHLDMLYLLTVADTYTTNPKLWTNWRSQLMQILYTNTRNALRRGLTNPINKEEHIEDIQTQALSLLADQGITETQARNVWNIAGDDYFIRESIDSIVWHTSSIIEHQGSNAPLVALRQTPSAENEGSTEIFIYVRNHHNLFAATTATLDQLNLNIQDARIVTSDSENLAMDTYTVLDESYQPIADSDRLNRVRDAILDTLLHPEDYNTIIQRRTPRLLKYFPIPTQVVISNDPSLQRTILEVIAADRPGLLARVGAILSDFSAQFLGARILTEGEKVSDIFFIVDKDGLPYSDPNTCQALIDAVKNGLDDQVQVQSAV